jgi:hypothetical protein
MSSKPYKSKQDLQRESLELTLTERRFALGREACFLILTVALIVTTIISAWHGAPWPVPGSTGILASLSAFNSRRGGPRA